MGDGLRRVCGILGAWALGARGWPARAVPHAVRGLSAAILTVLLAAPLAAEPPTPTPPTPTPAPPAPAPAFFHESPELATRVARGELPPIKDRLPANPALIQVEEEVGTYGGIWRIAMVGEADGLLLYRNMGYEQLVRWDPSWRRVIPNVAQSVQVADGNRQFTFRLRPGLRWSDGEPFTAEDIRFWFEDVLLDPELMEERPRWLPAGADAVRLEVPDPLTLRFVFAQPNSQFLRAMASGHNVASATEFPRHALARFHPRHNPEGIAAELAAAGVTDWRALFRLKARIQRSPSDPASLLRRPVGDLTVTQLVEPVPTLDPWVLERREPGDPPRYVALRNPYYWKVDRAGNQLPYIDRVEVLETSPARLADLLRAGRLGMQVRHVGTRDMQDHMPDLQARGYRTVPLIPAGSNVMPLVFNLTHPDPARRALLADRSLRIALSRAIDRKAVIDDALGGQGEPWQVAPRRESPNYSDRLAHQYLEHDPDAASAALDALGLDRRDGEGYRLDAEGRRVSLTLLTRRDRPYQAAVGAAIAAQWRAVGVELVVETLDRVALQRRVREGRFDIVPGTGDGGMDAVQEAHAYIPLSNESAFGLAWVRWLKDPSGPGAEEPPEPVKHQWAIHRRLQEAEEPEERQALVAELLDSVAEAFVQIGIATDVPRFAVARKDFRNVPRMLWDSWIYPTPAPTNPAQYYIDAP
ncbi:ABC transporter substrate-binding protein [Azospirillum sp. sgz302134]